MKLIPAEHLRTLRNDVPVRIVLGDLRVPTKSRGRRLVFRCPLCGGSQAAINPQHNLLRCFRCAKDFNPIDLVMALRNCPFREAVTYIERFLPACR